MFGWVAVRRKSGRFCWAERKSARHTVGCWPGRELGGLAVDGRSAEVDRPRARDAKAAVWRGSRGTLTAAEWWRAESILSARRRARAWLLSYDGRTVDALASRADEGRGRLRQAAGSRQQALIRGYPNGATHPESCPGTPT